MRRYDFLRVTGRAALLASGLAACGAMRPVLAQQPPVPAPAPAPAAPAPAQPPPAQTAPPSPAAPGPHGAAHQPAAATPPTSNPLTPVGEWAIPDAGQGVAVDRAHFYAIDNRVIAKYDKKTGALVKRWEGERDGPIVHLDGAVVRGGRLYAAHSNYPGWPMTSSLEVWDTATLEHVGSHSFGINWGSLTWVDFQAGHWWMVFANYDQLLGPNRTPYGNKLTTQLIKFTEDFRMVEAWVLPRGVLDRFGQMSNSGGSWGPDGFLYLTGHDLGELYKVRLPKSGSALELMDTVPLAIRGQGIAWDRSDPGVLYGVVRATPQEQSVGGTDKVVAFRLQP